MAGETIKTTKGYRARYWHQGAYHTPGHSFSTKALANAWLAAEHRLIQLDNWTAPKQRRAEAQAAEERQAMTLAQFCTEELDRRAKRSVRPLKRTTIDRYRKDLSYCLPTLGALPLHELTRAKVQSWYDKLDADTPTQRANAYATLKSLLNGAVHLQLIAANPCQVLGAGKPAPKRPGHALDAAQLLAYLDVLDERYRLLLTITALAGLRSGEARGLRRADLDLKAGVVKVRQAVSRVTVAPGREGWHVDTPKTRAGVRDVALPPDWLPVLRKWAGKQPVRGREALMFPALNGVSPITDSVMREAHQRAIRDANAAIALANDKTATRAERASMAHLKGVALLPDDLWLHDLRSTALTLAAEGGATLAELMRMAGHTTSTMVMRYQKASADRDRARAERLGALLSRG